MIGFTKAKALLLAPALLAGALSAQVQDASAKKTDGSVMAIYAKRVYIGNGQSMDNAYLVVRDGKVVRVTTDKPAETPIVDASTKVIMPGIVAADSDLARHSDNNYSINPDFVALEGFDFLKKQPRPLSGGVTTAYLSPGRSRLITGQGSVVKLWGEGILDRVVAEKAALRLTLGPLAQRAPTLFEPDPSPTADNPLKPARRQYPSSRLSQLAELRRIFQEAQTTKKEKLGTGSAENRYSPQPLRDAASGKLRLRISAQEAADLNQAVRFATRMGTQLVLENPYAVDKLIQLHGDKKLMVVCRMPVRPGNANSGGENKLDETTKNKPENAILAKKAGYTVALVPATDADLPDFLLMAGMAIRLGMTPEEALASITLDAAKILGVDTRVGSLEAGKDADFLVLSGEPFAIGTMVEDTFIDGRQAWHRATESLLLVVKARRIITCEGRTIDNGSIIVSGGKIKGVGRDLAIPYGARVVDMGDAVIVPGFVDAFCHAGLSGEGTGIPRGAADQQLTKVIDPQDPVLRQVAAAGMTTVLVSGTDGGAVSGRVAAIKTAAADKKSMVLKEIAAIRFVHDNINVGGINSLAGQINQGKKYIALWQKYEKDLADWKSGKKKTPAKPAPKPTETPKPKAADPITGKWGGAATLQPMNAKLPMELELKLEGTKVTGTLGMVARGRGGQTRTQKIPISKGVYEKGNLTLEATQEARGQKRTMTIVGTVANDEITGTFTMPMGPGRTLSGDFSAKRGASAQAPTRRGPTSSTSTTSKKKDDGRPKKPKVNEALEPMKALLEKKIPAVVNSTRAPAIRQIVDYFEKAKLPYILSGVRDAVDTPDILGKAKPGILLRPEVVRRKKGKIVNAAAKMSDYGLPVALVSGATAGARYLPLHAAHAIRYGMDPEEALKALTIYPATMFKLDDRIGSLKRGKDADFVVYSGSPFEMTSRIQLVVVNGKIVVDNRKEKK